MKNIILGTIFALTAASAAQAGALVDPIVEPVVIVEEATTSSSAGILIPILLILFLGVALSGGGESGSITNVN